MSVVARPSWVLFVLAVLGLTTAGAHAQDVLLVSGHNFGTNRTFGLDLGPAPFLTEDSVFAGGRYRVTTVYPEGFGQPSHVEVAELRTGATTDLSGLLMATDRARPRIFVARASGLWRLDIVVGQDTPIWTGDGTLIQQCALAESPNRLYCAIARLDGMSDVVEIDAVTAGARSIAVVQLPNPAYQAPWGWVRGGTSAWKVTSDGQRLYFGGVNQSLSVLRTATGQVTTSTMPYASWFAASLKIDEVNQRVIVIGTDASGGGTPSAITVLSADLAVLVSGDVPALCNNLAISPHTGRLYLAQFPYDSCPGSCGGKLTLQMLDATTYASLAAPAVPPGAYRNNECAYVAVLTAPGPPRDFAATVSGRDVTLRWTNVGGASGFVLDAGVAPGRTDIQVWLGPEATVTVPAVPPGVYYLRLRGGNEFGGGRASNEVRVVVP